MAIWVMIGMKAPHNSIHFRLLCLPAFVFARGIMTRQVPLMLLYIVISYEVEISYFPPHGWLMASLAHDNISRIIAATGVTYLSANSSKHEQAKQEFMARTLQVLMFSPQPQTW